MVTSGYGSYMVWHSWTLMAWFNKWQDFTWTPCKVCMDVVRAPHGNLKCFFVSYGTYTGLMQDSQGCRKAPLGRPRELAQPEFTKFLQGRLMWPYGPLMIPAWTIHELFTISKLIWARKLIMHALTHWPLGDLNDILYKGFSSWF